MDNEYTCEGPEAARCLGHIGNRKMSGPPAAHMGEWSSGMLVKGDTKLCRPGRL